LLDSVGTDRAALSRRAQELLLDQREGRTNWERIQAAALLPAMHKEMWSKYEGRLPSDETLKYELITERGFTSGGAEEFIAEWKRTMAFARLTEQGATVSPDAGGSDDEKSKEPKVTPPPTLQEKPLPPRLPEETPRDPVREQRTVQVTYSPTEWALLQAAFPMSEEDWESMLAVLAAMKRGLVTPAATLKQ
jgi:hypothetical protein